MSINDDTNLQQLGFTLVELSIVLVIIGLLVGGILVGRDLINAANIRAQISQIDKYQAAVKTFRLKYGALPGDMTNDVAKQLGFVARGTGVNTGGAAYGNPAFADGDGNGMIEGYCTPYGGTYWGGETSMFWNDLGVAQLIDGSFPGNTDAVATYIVNADAVGSYLPQAKIGNGNYVLVWSGGYGIDYGDSGSGSSVACADGNTPNDDTNYFAIAQMPNGLDHVNYYTGPGLSVIQAYVIDAKMDDGLPQSGEVIAMYPNASVGVDWAGDYPGLISAPSLTPPILENPGSDISCYDNSKTASGTPGEDGARQHYSTEMNGGSGINCALSFKFE